MLPASVESNVEQYLKKNWRHPCARNQSSAASDCATASAAGIVRDFSATTSASASTASFDAGTPMVCTVRMPPRTSMLARSVAPVKSSAMQPSSARPGRSGHGRLRAYFAAGKSMPGKILITAESSSPPCPAVDAIMNI